MIMHDLRDNSVTTVTSLGSGRAGFDSRQRQGFISSLPRPYRYRSGAHLSPIQWVLGGSSLRIKRPDYEIDHLPPSSAEVKNAWGYTATPPIRFHGVELN